MTPPSEAAAHQRGVKRDRLGRQPGLLGGGVPGVDRDLVAGPDLHPVAVIERGGVQRLHLRMAEIGHGIIGAHLGRAFGQGLHLAPVEEGGIGLALHRAGQGGEDFVCAGGVGACGPVDGLGPLHRRPGVVGHHGHAVAQIDHRLDAGQGQRLRRVEAGHCAALPGIAPERGEFQAGQAHVDREFRRAGRLGRLVMARLALADIAPGAARAQLCLDGLDLCRFLRQLGIGDPRPVGGDHRPVLGLEHRARPAQPLRCRLLQRFAGRGTGMAHLLEPVGGRGGAAGDLEVEELARHPHLPAKRLLPAGQLVIGDGQHLGPHAAVVIGLARRAVFDPQRGGVDVQLFRRKRRPGGAHALAHLGLGHDHCHPLAVHDDERVERDLTLFGHKRVGRGLARGIDPEGNAPGHGGGADQEGPAGDLSDA